MANTDMLFAAGAAVAGVFLLREMDNEQSNNPLSGLNRPLRTLLSPSSGTVSEQIDRSLGGSNTEDAPDDAPPATVSDGINSPGGLPPGVDQIVSVIGGSGNSSNGSGSGTNWLGQTWQNVTQRAEENEQQENSNPMAGIRL